MPRRVAHEFSADGMRLVSPGVYDVTILLNSDDVERVKGLKWCYEQTKGMVYLMDLTMELSTKLGYNTPRVYLRDYILFLHGYDHRRTVWRRHHMNDYRLVPTELLRV